MSYTIAENSEAIEKAGLKIWCPSVDSVERQTIRHSPLLADAERSMKYPDHQVQELSRDPCRSAKRSTSGVVIQREQSSIPGKPDVAENEYSMLHGLRLLSSYQTDAGEKLWIITEADRSATTLLLPAEY